MYQLIELNFIFPILILLPDESLIFAKFMPKDQYNLVLHYEKIIKLL